MSLWNGTPRLDGVRVLLVERLRDVREVVAETLGQCGAQVIAADSALEGLALFKRERPDVVVSGLSLPDKDGYWLIRQIRDRPRHLRDARRQKTGSRPCVPGSSSMFPSRRLFVSSLRSSRS